MGSKIQYFIDIVNPKIKELFLLVLFYKARLIKNIETVQRIEIYSLRKRESWFNSLVLLDHKLLLDILQLWISLDVYEQIMSATSLTLVFVERYAHPRNAELVIKGPDKKIMQTTLATLKVGGLPPDFEFSLSKNSNRILAINNNIMRNTLIIENVFSHVVPFLDEVT